MWPWTLLFIVMWWYSLASSTPSGRMFVKNCPVFKETYIKKYLFALTFQKLEMAFMGLVFGDMVSFRAVGGFPTPCGKGWYHILWRKHAAILGSMLLAGNWWTNGCFFHHRKKQHGTQKVVVCTPLKFKMELKMAWKRRSLLETIKYLTYVLQCRFCRLPNCLLKIRERRSETEIETPNAQNMGKNAVE